jgi:hypothetical protein
MAVRKRGKLRRASALWRETAYASMKDAPPVPGRIVGMTRERC